MFLCSVQKTSRLDSQSKFQMFTLVIGRHIGKHILKILWGLSLNGEEKSGNGHRGIGESKKNGESDNRRIGESGNWRIRELENQGIGESGNGRIRELENRKIEESGTENGRISKWWNLLNGESLKGGIAKRGNL